MSIGQALQIWRFNGFSNASRTLFCIF